MSVMTPNPTRRTLLATTAALAAVSLVPETLNAAAAAVDGTAIRPFHIHFPQSDLDDLKHRIAATRWPEGEPVKDASQGVQLATMQKLAAYWESQYDWSKFEARLHAFPHFITQLAGLDIHFIHVRSKHKNALPLIITHGWPGSIVEELKVIEPLTNPTAHGGTAADAFDVVIPSLPGYGFSGKPTEPGWDPGRTARAWGELIKRLGYDQFVAQGGDWGDPVTEQMAVNAPSNVRAINLNMPSAVPAEIFPTLGHGGPAPAGLSPDEKHAWDQLDLFFTHGLGYAQEMTQRPQTLYALADSPVGLAAWILDHDIRSYELIARVFDGQNEGLSRDDILDNITLYWLTNTAVSSARLYWENKLAFFAPQGVKIPVAVSAFPDELYQAPRSWAERAFPHLIHYNKLPKGGHFAAWEQPEFFVSEMRASFKSLR